MRCLAKCIANSFKLTVLAEYLKSQGYVVDLYRDVLQASYPGKDKELFFFAHGSFVTWGLTGREERQLVEQILPFSVGILNRRESRYFVYRYGSKTRIHTHKRFQVEIISLASDQTELKLALSYGLAQSIKLEFYEETVKKIIMENTPLFESLARTGKVLLTRKEITMRMGTIFLTRSSVNLNSEYLDVPEYFWEYPNLETDYLISIHFFDVQPRVAALNQQLDVLHELFNMLNGQLQHQHTSYLEVIIIVIVALEAMLSIFQIGWMMLSR
ncbi:MAG: sporulation protein [Legionellales bacterium]|nr:sporulation protein [Legionellales bacterium]